MGKKLMDLAKYLWTSYMKPKEDEVIYFMGENEI